MNRFSPLSTLSKFKTAVRETVDFVIKNSTQLTIIAGIMMIGGLVQAQTATGGVSVIQPRESSADELNRVRERAALLKTICNKKSSSYDADGCDVAKRTWGINDDRSERQCTVAEEKVAQAEKAAKESCTKAGIGSLERCYDQVKTCQKEELELDDLDAEDEGGQKQLCDRVMANKCSGLSTFMTGRNYREEKKDAEKDRKEAKRLVDDLTADQADLKKDLVKQQRELQEEQMKAAFAARQKERQIANDMKEALAGITDQQKKAFADAQKAYTAMDADYISMRAQIRQAADAVAQAEDELQTTCRGAAEKKYAEAEKVRIAELKARSKNVGSSVSGSTARRKAATARARNIDYTAYLSECTSGSSAEGVSARNRIKAAQRQKESTEKILNEKALLIEKQRSQILKQLQDMEGDATNQQTQVVEKINEQLTAMNEQQQLTAQLNQQRITEFQQNQSSAMASIQQKLMTANQELMESQKEISLATTRESCAGANAQRSESKRERVEEGFSSAVPDIEALFGTCRAKARACAGATADVETDSSGPKVRDICAITKDVITGVTTTTDGKTKKRGSVRVKTDQ